MSADLMRRSSCSRADATRLTDGWNSDTGRERVPTRAERVSWYRHPPHLPQSCYSQQITISHSVRWSGAGGGWGCSDTGRERVPTRAEARAAKYFELQEAIRCGKRVSRGFGDRATSRTCTQFRMRMITSVPPTHPTSPFHSSRRPALLHGNTAAPISQCRAGGARFMAIMAWRGGTRVLNIARA